MNVVTQLALHSGVNECGVPNRVGVALKEGRIKIVPVGYPVPDTSVQLGYDRVVRPRLESQEYPVLKLGNPDRVVGVGRVVELVLIKLPADLVGSRDLVLVPLPEYGIF